MDKYMYRDYDWLKKQKERYGSGKAISRETGIPETNIHRYLKKYGLNDTPPESQPWDDKKWLIEQYRAGKEIRQIAEEIGCSTASITLANRKFGISAKDYNPRYKYRDKEWLEEQFELYGHVSAVAESTGYPRTSITRYAEKYGIREKEFERVCKNKVDEDYFKEINTAEKAYWLGFIMADGNIYEHDCGKLGFSVKLKSTDREHVEMLAEHIGFSGFVREIIGVRKNTMTQGSQVRVYNNTFSKHLVSHGITPRKSGTEHIPESVPSALVKDFIRGFIDGDGWVYNNKNGFKVGFVSSSIDIMQQCKDYLECLVGGLPKIFDSKNCYMFSASSKPQVYKILKHLYYPGCVALERKQKTANEIIKQYEDKFIGSL